MEHLEHLDVIEFNLRAKENIFGDRCRTASRARQRAKRKLQRRAQFGVPVGP